MKFKIISSKGDSLFDYPTAIAEIKFDELVKDRYLPMVLADGKHHQLKKFDPNADEVLWVPAVAGG